MSKPQKIDQLAEALRCLPGVGLKTAHRMVLYLLERDRDAARHLAASLNETMDDIKNCTTCRNFTEFDSCEICSAKSRDQSKLCVVENPGDVKAIEQTGHYRGLYFVLMGNLSPLDGLGPEDIGLDLLLERCSSNIEEVILAVGSSVEGEATAHYISEMIKPKNIMVSRIAQGIPIGGELEYVDGGTLAHAFSGRNSI